jgi:hypothetical protein
MSKSTFHVAFPLSEATKDRTYQMMATVRAAEHPHDHVSEITDVIIQMTEEGLKYLFLDSLHHAKVGKFQIQAVQMGVQGARKGLELVGRRALKAMSDEQLLGIVDYMENILVEVVAEE